LRVGGEGHVGEVKRLKRLAVRDKGACAFGQEIRAETLGELRGQGMVWGAAYPKTDVYFEVSGAPGVLSAIAGFANKNSRIITVAMNREPVTLDATRIMSKEISIIGAQGYPVEFQQVMDGISRGAIDPEQMITHRFPFSDFLHAFEIADDASNAAKVVLEFA